MYAIGVPYSSIFLAALVARADFSIHKFEKTMKKLPSTAPCFAKIWTSQPACERARPAAVWFVLLQVLFTMAKSLAQCPEPFNILANPDFEQYTCVAVPPNTTVDGAFNNGCAVQWQAANQTPSICSGTPQSGQLYACLGYSEPPSVVKANNGEDA